MGSPSSEPAPDSTAPAANITTSSGKPAPLALTPEQARILYDLVQVNSALIEGRWSRGIWYGLVDALFWIECAGGAYVDDRRDPLG
jgi:hypothetical protein